MVWFPGDGLAELRDRVVIDVTSCPYHGEHFPPRYLHTSFGERVFWPGTEFPDGSHIKQIRNGPRSDHIAVSEWHRLVYAWASSRNVAAWARSVRRLEQLLFDCRDRGWHPGRFPR